MAWLVPREGLCVLQDLGMCWWHKSRHMSLQRQHQGAFDVMGWGLSPGCRVGLVVR
jgi:hypothetical protein